MKRIAIAFYGIPRSANICFPQLASKVLKPISESFELKCFYHFYHKTEVINPRSGEKGDFPSAWYDYFADFQGSIEKPDICLDEWNFEKIKAFGDSWGDNFQSLNNLIHQLNSLHKVTERVMSSGFEYDAVLFLRPDLFYHQGFPVSLLTKATTCDDAVAWVPAWQWFGGLNDRFSICSKSAVTAYGKRIESVFDYVQSHHSLHAESLLKFRLECEKVQVRPIFINASRVRIDGEMRDENFSYRTCMDYDRTSIRCLSELAFFQVRSFLNIY
ncbi:hypothetical protein [Thalassolituus sp.]|uniref:hypothetical protein n=1 Tax=Thalassolituus sp. TaxID=2030822 RepID=UPI003513C8FB